MIHVILRGRKVMWEIKKFIGWHIKGIRRKLRRMSPEKKRLIAVMMIALLVGGVAGNAIGRFAEQKKSEEKIAQATAKVKEEEQEKLSAVQNELEVLQSKVNTGSSEEQELPWYLVLVNRNNPMDEGYVPELTELTPGYSVDSRIADAANKMLADAKGEGLHIIACSAYRSVNRQEQLFNQTMQAQLNKGLGYLDAYQETAMSVAVPGTSEHALGLALDLISNKYTTLDEGQENTAEAKWLAANCHKYGFILRYPPDKTDITGIIYEPWHYRYVGVEDATKIKELGITLEEYLEAYYGKEGGQ